ncbi:MAG: Fic family protein [Lentisphaeria bacterium]|nr:Fic family protein [Lentisphaeria bacterium]
MKNFDYSVLPGRLLTPEVSNLISAIHEYRGKQQFFVTARKDVLESLLEVAVIQSTDASNRIEGIFTSNARLKELVAQKTQPLNRNEEEIAGYRYVLSVIHENHDFIPIKPSTLLQLHRDLYRFQPFNVGGNWKSSDNLIAGFDNEGVKHIRFTPVPAFETPEAVENLCKAYNEAIALQVCDPLILLIIFIFDFLCIHPFADGNGRMSRLLTILLLYQQNYIVGKYVSLEKIIEENKQSYYETLHSSGINWNENSNDPLPFLRYMLGIILSAYRDFEKRLDGVTGIKRSKSDRIKQVFEQKLGKIKKSDIVEACPDISISMIERTLKQMQNDGTIERIGFGRETCYIKK